MAGRKKPLDIKTLNDRLDIGFALKSAQLGVWELDPITNLVNWDDRCRELFGLAANAIMPYEQAIKCIHRDDVDRVDEAVKWAMNPQSGGNYDVTYRTIGADDGLLRWVRFMGKSYFSKAGRVIRFAGLAQNVTKDIIQNQQLQQQTEELAANNEELVTTSEELAANNEELTASNDELLETNQLLARSNENLLQFAYVASHDLQEPLRKIQQFADLLIQRHAVALGEGADHLGRIQLSANRMSALIKDLLVFSSISIQRETTSSSVSLTEVVNEVLTDLDLMIQVAGAIVQVDSLPTLTGDASQLRQLFQNLLSNAIKFSQSSGLSLTDTVPAKPLIRVRTDLIRANKLPPSVKPTRITGLYYQINIIDNGVGFDEKYLDRIFQVFQRLHSKKEFAGTGIGLAICEKVMVNHGGAITASSQPGKGATFSVFFPFRSAT